MLKRIHKIISLNIQKICLIVFLNIFEAFFLVSSVLLLFPFLKYLVGGKEATVELLNKENYRVIWDIFNRLNIEINLLSLILLAIIPVIVGQILTYLKIINIVKVQQQTIFRLRDVFVNKLFNTNLTFLKSCKVGELSNSIAIESQRVGLSVQYIINFYSYLFISVIYLAVLFSISKDLMLITIFGISFVPFMVRKQNIELKELGKVVASSNENIQNFIIEKIRMLKKILLLNKKQDEIISFKKISKVFEDTYLKSGAITAFVEVILEPIIFIVAMLIVYIGVEFMELGFDHVVMFLFVLMKFNRSIKSVIMTRNQINIYSGSFDLYTRYLELLADNQVVHVKGGNLFNALKNSIVIKKLKFSFGDSPLFENLNLSIPAKKTTAFVGKSGAGKSTLIDILLGFNKADSGEILFDGTEIGQLDICSLREKIGFVTQDNYLTSGSIKDNLLYGLGDKSDLQIQEACKKAHILNFVESLQDKFGTHIGESGGKLSGGQKQRIQLAHLFLQDPEIIIMDEPTSALDSESERVIVSTLKEMCGKKTIILIAHRLSTIQHADKIVVIEDGKILEEGTHLELLENEGSYKKYFENRNGG